MATLQQIRNRGGLLVSIVIGLALVAFIVGDALTSGASVFNRKRNQVGEIDGNSISIIDYQKRVGKNEDMVKAMNGAAALTEEQQTMLRENTWQQMIMESLMNKEYEELGIDVSGDELYDVLLGDNMSPAIRQLFADPNTGTVDINNARNTIKTIINSGANSPQRAYWLNMEEEIATSRRMEKYNALLAKSLFVTDAEAQANAQNEANKTNISYIVKNYSVIEDSIINVTPAEIKSYYNDNQKRFEQPETRKIVYVNFDIAPSDEDFSETNKIISNLITEFREIADAAELVNLSSDKKFDSNYYSKAEIENDSLANFLFSGSNDVFGPYLENQAYKISKTVNKKVLPDSVKVRHIMLAVQNNNPAKTQAIADSLLGLLNKGGDFNALALANSTDQNSAVNGGDLGWFTQKTLPFGDSVFFAKKNVAKIIPTQYGLHIVQVTDMTKPVEKIQIATLEKEITPSAATMNKIYNDARLFATDVTSLADFDKKVTETGLTKRIATVNKNDRGIAGMENARDMVRQIYLSETPDQIVGTTDGSVIFENGGKYTVAVITEINEEGIAPLNSVSSNIKRLLVQKKKAEILKKELESAKNGNDNFLAIAQKAGLEIKEAPEITFNSFQIPGAGIEPKVIATATMTEQGKISPVIDGNQGVYIIMVNNRTTEEVTPENIQAVKAGMEQNNMYRANYQALNALMKNANIKDQRYKFY